ncbi:MAG: hypothetical protein ACI86M_001853 [Saprospiraceae bacterium]|jgi:hypothetical protein
MLQDESPICDIVVRVRSTEENGCSIIKFDNSIMLDPTVTNSLIALHILVNPCLDENYTIALENHVLSDSVSLDWSTLPNPFFVVINTGFISLPSGTFIHWDGQCYQDPICRDTFIIAAENEAVLIPKVKGRSCEFNYI